MTIIRLPSNPKNKNPAAEGVPINDPTAMSEAELIASLKNGQDLDELDVSRKIMVLGLGGTGCNAICNLERLNPPGVRMLACNTDKEDLRKVKQEHRFLIGIKTTRGQGAGSNPDKGRRAMEEQLPQLLELIGPVDMVILVAGMGGGTGTGSAPVIAEALSKAGILVVAIVTMPQRVDGLVRMNKAIEGKQKLESVATSMVTILNDKLPVAMGNRGSLQEAFKYADSVLLDGISNIIDVMNILGVDNLDYADIENGLSGGGRTMISVGHADGENAEIVALEKALFHDIIEPSNIRSATHGMVNIIGSDQTLDSLMVTTRVKERLNRELDVNCDVKFGYTEIPNLIGTRILIILSGMDGDSSGDAVVRMPRIAPDPARNNLTLVLSDPLPPSEVEAIEAAEARSLQGQDRDAIDETMVTCLYPADRRTETEVPFSPADDSYPADDQGAAAVASLEVKSAAVETKTRIRGFGALVQQMVNGQPVVTSTEEDLESLRQKNEEELQRKKEEETMRRAKEMEIPPIPGFLNRFSS